MQLSELDRKILKVIQRSPSLSQVEQAELTGMSRSSFWRHVKEMEDVGIIGEHIPEISAKKVGLKLRANCMISLNNHSLETRQKFEKHIIAMDNVLECHATSGGKDYMLTVVAKDMDDYYEIMSSSILDHPTIDNTQTSFFMKEVKSTRRLPL